jgi:hypothetical protein
MSLNSVTKSKILKRMVKTLPILMSKKGVQNLTVGEKPVFGFEDASQSMEEASFNEGSVADINKKVEELQFDIFPAIRLQAELQIAKDTNRALFDELNMNWESLEKSIAKLETAYGKDFEMFLQDEIATQPPDAVNADLVKKLINTNAGLDLITINSENIKW